MSITSRAACLGALLVTGWAIHGASGAATLVSEPPTPHSAPVEVIPTPADQTRLAVQLDGRAEGIWLDGDVLWLAKNSPDGDWKTIGSVSHPLTRIDNSDIWAIGLRWDRWPEATMQVAFLGGQVPARDLEYQTWRGERAPAPPAQAEPGNIESFKLPGPIQGTERDITLVLPPGYEGEASLPALVLADGQSAEAWGKVIAALVIAKKVRPVVVVGVHSGAYEGDRTQPYNPKLDVRAREYLEGYDQDRFDAHLDWLINSVLPEIARRYAVSLEREELGIAGFSNGGAFAASAALRRGDVFGTALAMSIGVPPEIEPLVPDAPMARFYFAAGELEHQFLDHTKITRDRVKAAGAEVELLSFVAGHDAEMWRLAMSRFLPLMFPCVETDADAKRAD